ncbi:DNA/RNA non-specific endonuclease [Tychonema sp. LEGE 07203]|uniref:DNA/RNA non-specific endonuclease n=1 Tax=Tychonema sp. LEGE 07203 TaxID=1828671 RepID=UPI001880D0E0|nr:DNA/RNA non-specific endonuclease [Tychonema sp. LEGE 07203]MBE9093680.1 DNA/RNA non-specific endonuclease [Tychonema sp. LEGE 07203]
MRQGYRGWAIALILLGIISGCNLTEPSPPSRFPEIGREKPRVQRPTPKPSTREPISSATNNRNLLLGNPSNAVPSVASNIDNYLMVKPQYVLSYNSKTKTANWVSWQLNKSWIGAADRQDNFRPDDSLPDAWYKVRPNDYTGSGYDRGHIAPSADRTRTETDNSSTFLMTNMMPQVPELNRGLWSDLEDYCRDLVQQGKELYIIAGPVGRKDSIGKKEKIAVPAKNWKVIVVLPRQGLGMQGITADTRTIAVIMPNDASVKGRGWKSFRVSVARIEQETGLNFLSNVSPQTQQVIESKVDSQ